MKTVVVGASPKSYRYSNRAIQDLLANNHEVIGLGTRPGNTHGLEIIDIRSLPKIEGVDTITLYVSRDRLRGYEDYLLSLKPQRIIFNPGAENDELQRRAIANGVEVNNACTLVMLSTGAY